MTDAHRNPDHVWERVVDYAFELDSDELAAFYADVTGRRPHPSMYRTEIASEVADLIDADHAADVLDGRVEHKGNL